MKEIKRRDDIQGDIIHEYDGIEEADNALPTWWLAMFYLSTIFAAGYWFYYHGFKLEPGPAEALAAQLATERAAKAAEAAKAPAGGENLLALSQDPTVVAAGKAIYTTNCVACHDVGGIGKIGPNLTDTKWIHGGSPAQIMEIIDKGFVAKGMVPWGGILGPKGVREVTAYVLTLRGTNVAGKAPEGDEYTGP